ncbi:hypothetical protein ACFP3Q_01565 [Nocardioides sp. GCM10027113]|uniref:hypothetical protein n=1 Tax=unclassified Nocardioides TaxID=2615069 RepID=UPI0036091912
MIDEGTWGAAVTPSTVAVALGIAGCAVLLAGVLGLALLRARTRHRLELAAARAETAALRAQVAQVQRRLAAEERRAATELRITDLDLSAATAEARPAAGRPPAVPARPAQGTPATTGAAPGIDRALFADLVLRETVVRAASLAHGVRRALAPETRNRVRFEVRREIRRARKQRRADLREARRDWEARQRATLDDEHAA